MKAKFLLKNWSSVSAAAAVLLGSSSRAPGNIPAAQDEATKVGNGETFEPLVLKPAKVQTIPEERFAGHRSHSSHSSHRSHSSHSSHYSGSGSYRPSQPYSPPAAAPVYSPPPPVVAPPAAAVAPTASYVPSPSQTPQSIELVNGTIIYGTVLVKSAAGITLKGWDGKSYKFERKQLSAHTIAEQGLPEESQSESETKSELSPSPQMEPKVPNITGPDANDQRLTKFTNQKYGCAILVPLDVFPDPPQQPDDEHTKFVSTDGRTTLELVVDQNPQKRAVAEVYRKWIAQGEKKGAIGYKTLKGNWFVVSGDVAGRGYYTKCVGRDNKLFFMNVDYDEEADAIRENTMTTMSRSFNGRP